MDFATYKDIRDTLESIGVDRGACDMSLLAESWPSLKKSLLAAAAGGALLYPLIPGPHPAVDPVNPTTHRLQKMDPADARRAMDKMKDEGKYYSPLGEQKLRKRAEAGDTWAVRELPWPEGHRFHKLGRPFFRNSGPHPDGIFMYSGYR